MVPLEAFLLSVLTRPWILLFRSGLGLEVEAVLVLGAVSRKAVRDGLGAGCGGSWGGEKVE
jgi:hypothetical protein